MFFRGENRKKPELPFKKVPVLTHGDFTVAESTSILRYIGQLEGGAAWYGARSIQEKAKVDEFLDYWQSTLHPNVIRLTQNKLLFKVKKERLCFKMQFYFIYRWYSDAVNLIKR